MTRYLLIPGHDPCGGIFKICKFFSNLHASIPKRHQLSWSFHLSSQTGSNTDGHSLSQAGWCKIILCWWNSCTKWNEFTEWHFQTCSMYVYLRLGKILFSFVSFLIYLLLFLFQLVLSCFGLFFCFVFGMGTICNILNLYLQGHPPELSDSVKLLHSDAKRHGF